MKCPHCSKPLYASHCTARGCLWSNCLPCAVTVDTDGRHFHYKHQKHRPGDEWWKCPSKETA